MSEAVLTHPPRAGTQVEQAVSSLVVLGQSLVESYTALEQRARHVEDELVSKIAELDSMRRHLEGVLAAIPTGVIVRDASGAIVRSNPAAKELVRRMGPSLLTTAPQPAPGEWGQRDLRDGDGVRIVLAQRVSPLDPAAQIGSVELLDDRTSLAELQERLHSLDKIAALGNVAGGIAHEIKNPMNAIKGFSAMLEKRLPAGTDEQRWSSWISAASCQVEEVLASMLTLAAPDRLILETIDAGELAQSAVSIALAEIPPEMQPQRWQVRVQGTAPTFPGDRIKLRQALRNLIANAIQAQPDGGPVTVSFETRGGELVFEVADGGPGIPADLRLRVLDPFFTTRAEGTGLGLALVCEITRLHGGRVEVSPRPSIHGGASMLVRLPLNRPT